MIGLAAGLQATEAECAANAVAPRVSIANIQAAIRERYHLSGASACGEPTTIGRNGKPADPLSILSICILVLHNGFTVIGKSAPASPENFNPELGRKLAEEDAIRQLWPLMGFALRERLSHYNEEAAEAEVFDGAVPQKG